MKKIVMIAFVAAATISFTACNTSTEGAAKGNADSANVEVTAPVDPVANATECGSALDRYADLVEKTIALQEKAQKGDAAAIKELTDLGQEATNLAGELQTEMATMTPEQTARFTELAKKLTDADSKAQ